jgi:hypothetical protein
MTDRPPAGTRVQFGDKFGVVCGDRHRRWPEHEGEPLDDDEVLVDPERQWWPERVHIADLEIAGPRPHIRDYDGDGDDAERVDYDGKFARDWERSDNDRIEHVGEMLTRTWRG